MKSTPELVRQQNSILVLAALRRQGRLAHTELSDFTGLSSATISAITGDLERGGIIERTELQPVGGRGRPRLLFSQRRDCAYLVTVIISSDTLQFSLVDYGGRLIDRFTEQRGADSGNARLFGETIRLALARIVGRSRIERSAVLAISISSKGIVDASNPVLAWSPVLGAESIDFRTLLAPDWDAAIDLSNETLLVASALGLRMERQRGSDALDDEARVALSLGHSIGLGIYQNRAGAISVTAPNFGHMLQVPAGALCRCGAQGCIEAYAGFYAILRTAFEVPPDKLPAKFVPLPELDKIAASARAGNRTAGFAFRQAGLALGNGLSRVFSLYGRMPVSVTGPGLRYFDLLRPGFEDGLRQSQVIRMEGLPEIEQIADEANLVFEGHLHRALSAIDREIVQRKAQQAAPEEARA